MNDAVWAARLLVDRKVAILSPETVLEICKELVRLADRRETEPVLFKDGLKVTP